MKIRHIKLHNFRQFYGENIIEFAVGQDKNVTLIHGENGVGKTTLLNSVLWCLFEYLTPDFERQTDLVNFEAVAEGTKTCRVEVGFDSDANHYLAQRHFDGTSKTTFKVYQVDEGNYREMPGPSGFINSILPKDMAPYFFFHGEGVAGLSDTKSRGAFRTAVRNILGFTFAEAAIADLTKIKREYGRKLSELTSQQASLVKASKEKESYEKDVARLEKRVADKQEEFADVSSRLKGVEEELGSSGNLDAERLKRELNASESRAASLKRNLASINKERQELIPKYGWSVFGSDLMTSGLEFIDESTLKGKIPSPYQESFVKDLLEVRECICGSPILSGSTQEARIKTLLQTANTALISQRLMKARGIPDRLRGAVDEFMEEYRKLDKERSRLDQSLGAEERTYQDLEKALDGIDEATIQRLSKARSDLKDRERTLLLTIGSTKRDLEMAKEQLNQITQKLKKEGAQSQAHMRLLALQDGIGEMIKRCEDRLNSFENSARINIAAKVNGFLEEFSRKDFAIKVDSNFDFHLVRKDGKISARSQGEKLLLNLAFVSALIQHAEQRVNAKGNFLVAGTVAPFVVDAPFGELDDTYRSATAGFLPNSVGQIAFLLSSSHWAGTVDESIRHRIGKEYALISHRRGAQGAKPTDDISINGTIVRQSKYNAERDCTSILELK